MRIRSLAGAGLVLSALSVTALSVTACSSASSAGSAASGSGATGSAASQSTAGASPASQTSQAGQASSSNIDVCSLMTAKHASSIVGVPYSKGTKSPNICTYASTNGSLGLIIVIYPDSGGSAAWAEELHTLEVDGSGAPVTLSGFSGSAAGDGDEMGVQVGSDIIDIHGGDPTGTGSAFPKSIALAKVIASELQ